jgi:hypothetical protein
MSVLQQLGADAATIEPSDIHYLGERDAFSFAIARGLQSEVPQLQEILHNIPISEDGDGEECVPIFQRLDRAATFIASDRHPDDEVHERLKQGAARDLVNNGLLDSADGYRGWLEPPSDEPRELPEEFRTSPKPYKSVFDEGSW